MTIHVSCLEARANRRLRYESTTGQIWRDRGRGKALHARCGDRRRQSAETEERTFQAIPRKVRPHAAFGRGRHSLGRQAAYCRDRSAFHCNAQRNAFRCDARQQSRLFAPENQGLRRSPQLQPALLRLSAMIRVFDEGGNVIETHEHAGEFKGDFVTRLRKRHARGGPESGYCLINSRASSAILFASSIHFLLMLNFTFTVKTMADVANKYAENVAGAFYVDDQCIDCDLCRETAPASFKRNDDGGHTYVYKQPETPEEEALCKEAMEGCPVEAIGNGGAIILAPLRA